MGKGRPIWISAAAGETAAGTVTITTSAICSFSCDRDTIDRLAGNLNFFSAAGAYTTATVAGTAGIRHCCRSFFRKNYRRRCRCTGFLMMVLVLFARALMLLIQIIGIDKIHIILTTTRHKIISMFPIEERFFIPVYEKNTMW